MSKKALIAMSGGVDSSVSAALMCEKGIECVGVTMKLHGNAKVQVSTENSCCTLSDVEDARQVATELGMDFHLFDFTEDFKEKVIDRFIYLYEVGSTPNPCIDCNRYMKFDRLYRKAQELGCDTVVTGHYARVEFDENKNRWILKKAVNSAKDQSYVLYFLSQEQLSHTYFPLGEYESKDDVRAVASKYGFINASKHDSQDICFVPDGDYASFIERITGKTYPNGKFVDIDGNVLGEHKGIIRYTIGQRKGLGLALPAPMYVRRKDLEKNTVILTDEKSLYSTELVANDFNWIAYDKPNEPVSVTAKPRYRAKEAPATAEVLEDGSVKITFDEPQRAITKGQAVVLYDGELVVGGGTIIKTD
ncbi:MAG: tRNA 2-thiouridine(34) synthase MnmA [Clostridia bacterium]|nr:tRNA 2-thiouridine(34) synthase MnmA [Clostridia bacterium]